MSLNLIRSLTKAIVDTLVAIEFNDDSMSNDDIAVSLMEQISAELQSLPEPEKNLLAKEIFQLSLSYPEEIRDFVQKLPDNLGITES